MASSWKQYTSWHNWCQQIYQSLLKYKWKSRWNGGKRSFSTVISEVFGALKPSLKHGLSELPENSLHSVTLLGNQYVMVTGTCFSCHPPVTLVAIINVTFPWKMNNSIILLIIIYFSHEDKKAL